MNENKALQIKVGFKKIFKNIENKLKTFQVPQQTFFSTKNCKTIFKNYFS